VRSELTGYDARTDAARRHRYVTIIVAARRSPDDAHAAERHKHKTLRSYFTTSPPTPRHADVILMNIEIAELRRATLLRCLPF